jgi:hypothetical protein
MRVLLMNDTTTNSNWGDRAAAISLKSMILAMGCHITHTITEDDLILSLFNEHFAYLENEQNNKSRETIKLFVPPLLLRARRKVFKNVDVTRANRLIPERWEDFSKAARTVLAGRKATWPALLRAIETTDVVVIHGDGAMVGNGIIPRTDLFLSYLIKTHFGKPVIIVNHGVDLDHPALRRMAEGVYPLFDDVVFRDPISLERCKTLCSGRFAADTAFWFRPAPKESWGPIARRLTYFDVWPDVARFDPTQPYLCLGGSSMLSTAWRPGEIIRGYAALVKHLRSIYGGQIVVTVSGSHELEVFRPLAAEFDLPLIAPTIPVQQAVDLLGHADAYIGGRWHTAIFALSGGAPVVALSAKQSKMSSLMLAAGLPTIAFDALDLEHHKEAIAKVLLEHLERGDRLRFELKSWADQMADNCWDNVAYLGKHAKA